MFFLNFPLQRKFSSKGGQALLFFKLYPNELSSTLAQQVSRNQISHFPFFTRRSRA